MKLQSNQPPPPLLLFNYQTKSSSLLTNNHFNYLYPNVIQTSTTTPKSKSRSGRKRRPAHQQQQSSSSSIDTKAISRTINSNNDGCGLSSASTEDVVMDECAAALVLMSLSASPRSPTLFTNNNNSTIFNEQFPNGRLTINSFVNFFFLFVEFIRNYNPFIFYLPKNKQTGTTSANTPTKLFKCTWRGCKHRTFVQHEIEQHVRLEHLQKYIYFIFYIFAFVCLF